MTLNRTDPTIPAMSFEAVDAHLTRSAASLAPERQTLESRARQVNLCVCYGAVRPLLHLVVQSPVFPRHWREALVTFVAAMDLLCPQTAAAPASTTPLQTPDNGPTMPG